MKDRASEIDPLVVKYMVSEKIVEAIRILIDDEEQVELVCSLSYFGYSQFEMCKVALMLKNTKMRLAKNDSPGK